MTPIHRTLLAILAFAILGGGRLLAEDLQTATTCVVPSFEFRWPDHRSPVLVATAEKEVALRVWVSQQPATNELTRDWLRAPKKRSRLARTCWPEGLEADTLPDDAEPIVYDHETYYPWDENGLAMKATARGKETSVNLVCFPHLFTTPHVVVDYEVLGDDVPEQCRAGTTEPLPVFDKHLIRFDVGSVFALNEKGEFDDSSELAITSTSKWSRKFTGVVDLRFSELGDLEEGDNGDGEQPAGDEGDSGDGEAGADNGDGGDGNGDDAVFSPFLKGGSFLRANAYLALHPWKWPSSVGGNRVGRSMSVVLGGGFSTVPGETLSFADAKVRYFAGVRFQIIGFNRGRPGTGLEDSFGFFQVGYARDKLWKYTEPVETEVDGETVTETRERDEQDRFFMESEIEVPRLGTKALRLVLRGFADLPTSGSGPADVRVSALVAVKPDQLAGIFGR